MNAVDVCGLFISASKEAHRVALGSCTPKQRKASRLHLCWSPEGEEGTPAGKGVEVGAGAESGKGSWNGPGREGEGTWGCCGGGAGPHPGDRCKVGLEEPFQGWEERGRGGRQCPQAIPVDRNIIGILCPHQPPSNKPLRASRERRSLAAELYF